VRGSPGSTVDDSDYGKLVRGARAYAESGRADRSADAAARAVELAPERPEAYVVWGHALAMQKELAKSAEKFERARKLGSVERQLFIELASVYDVTGKYDQAVEVYQAWLAKAPDDVEVLGELGLTLIMRERPQEAATILARAVELAPHDLQLRQDWAYALLLQGEVDRAAVELQKVLISEPDRADALRFLAQARALSGHEREALDLLDRLMVKAPSDGGARRLRARLRQVNGDPQGALADYEALLGATPTDGGLLLGAGGALLALGRFDEAARALEQARATLGDLPEVRFREAQLAHARGEKGALAKLHAAAKEMPRNVEAWRTVHQAARAGRDKRLEIDSGKRLVELGARPD
jgi:protein O-GlcNAc transferase